MAILRGSCGQVGALGANLGLVGGTCGTSVGHVWLQVRLWSAKSDDLERSMVEVGGSGGPGGGGGGFASELCKEQLNGIWAEC